VKSRRIACSASPAADRPERIRSWPPRPGTTALNDLTKRKLSRPARWKLSVLLGLAALAPAWIAACGRPPTSPAHFGNVTIVAAGDIACGPTDVPEARGLSCRQMATSDLVLRLHPTAVLPLGDDQYPVGRDKSYGLYYGPSWGRFKAISHPVPGNHEYLSSDANGYYDYFGAAAGAPSRGYYSFNLGAWHLIALNGNCSFIGGCSTGSPEERWLAADLRKHPSTCTLAYWHQPRFSSGQHGDEPTYGAFWRDLFAAHADIVLNGHDHDYERFAPQDPFGHASPSGLREFVIGTGGKNHYGFKDIQPNSVARNDTAFGVLLLTLRPRSYSWRFVSIAGPSFQDSGTGRCHL
jgi:acid phosphatase type 7